MSRWWKRRYRDGSWETNHPDLPGLVAVVKLRYVSDDGGKTFTRTQQKVRRGLWTHWKDVNPMSPLTEWSYTRVGQT